MYLEKSILDGKIRLAECALEDVQYLYDKFFPNFSHTFFTDEIKGHYSSMQAKEASEQTIKVLKKGIITNNGAIYPVYDSAKGKSGEWLEAHKVNDHVITSAFLRLNGISLENSVRYALYDNGLEFYPNHECFGLVEADSVEDLTKAYVQIYDKKGSDHIVGLSKAQINSMYKVARSFNQDLFQALIKNPSFAIMKKPYEIEDGKDSRNCKYNKLYLNELFAANEDELIGLDYYKRLSGI